MLNKKTSKIKWCFLITPYPLLMEFLGKFAHQILTEGDECILLVNSKIAEYSKLKYFPKEVKIFSKVDWLINNYKKNQRDFDDFSWKELFPDIDRFKLFKFNYENVTEIISQLYQFVEFIFQEEKPDVILYGMPGSFFAQVVYNLSKKYNITYLSLVHSRLPGRIDVFDLKYNCSKYEKTFRELDINNIPDEEKKFAKDFIENFISHRRVPSYMEYQSSYPAFPFKNYFRREKKMLWSWFRYFLKRKYFKPFDYESEIYLKYWIRYPLKFLKRKFKALFLKNIFDSLNKNDKFFLFPLQVQPELSTAGLATYFCDQLNTIKNTAFSLPFLYKLYVKEHPLAIGERSGNFYYRLKQIPNIVLVSPYENTKNLIKKSTGIITLTSTLGIEGILIGKPVYVCGDVFYSYHPSCRRIHSFEELKERINQDLIQKLAIKDLEDANIRFILSYFKNTIPGNLMTINQNDINNYELIYQKINNIFLNN